MPLAWTLDREQKKDMETRIDGDGEEGQCLAKALFLH